MKLNGTVPTIRPHDTMMSGQPSLPLHTVVISTDDLERHWRELSLPSFLWGQIARILLGPTASNVSEGFLRGHPLKNRRSTTIEAEPLTCADYGASTGMPSGRTPAILLSIFVKAAVPYRGVGIDRRMPGVK